MRTSIARRSWDCCHALAWGGRSRAGHPSPPKAAAKIPGIDQPKISALLRGKLTGFSTERLIRFLNALGRDVEIVVKERPRSKGPGHLQVVLA
jgi:hypothetical protein